MSTTQSDDAPDAALMNRVEAGDERALELLYHRHASMVFTLASRIVGQDDDAEEVTEDVFIQVWEAADRFDEERGTLKSYLATMTRSRALDRLRSRKRRTAAYDRASVGDTGVAGGRDGPEPTDRPAERSEARDRISEALNVLNDDQRRAIELAYFEGLSQSEIAERLDQPLGTIKTRIRDGMIKLRDRFTPAEAAQ